jgi:serine/threonine protein kinase
MLAASSITFTITNCIFLDLVVTYVTQVENQLRIVHRHIVRLYEVYETPDHLYLVLENCPCGELEKASTCSDN